MASFAGARAASGVGEVGPLMDVAAGDAFLEGFEANMDSFALELAQVEGPEEPSAQAPS